MPRSVKQIWNFIISIKLTITIFIILSLVCIIGTIIPQNAPEDEYLRLFSKQAFEFFKSTGCLDLYHAWWFLFLMTAFTINLISCSVNRIPQIKKLISKPKTLLDDATAQSLMCLKKITFKNHDQQIEKLFEKNLEEFLKKPEIIKTERQTHFFSEKGRFSYLAFSLTHLGLLIIIVGVLLGIMGFQGYITIFEGETKNTITLRKSNNFMKLPFEIRCDKFEVTFYDKGNMPKDYKSTLTVLDKGKEVFTKIIEVNDPLIYQGIFFYQSNYGTGSGNTGEILLKVKNKDSDREKNYHVKTGQRFKIDGTNDEIRINTIIPDFTINDNGKVVSRSSEPKNPAVNLTVFPDKNTPYSAWIFANHPDFHNTPDSPYVFSFLKLFPKFYTGLQVTRDPGVWTVWLGCSLVTLGLYLAFFMSHRRVWLKVEEKEGSLQVMLAGSSNKNKEAFKNDFDNLFKKIKATGEKR